MKKKLWKTDLSGRLMDEQTDRGSANLNFKSSFHFVDRGLKKVFVYEIYTQYKI